MSTEAASVASSSTAPFVAYRGKPLGSFMVPKRKKESKKDKDKRGRLKRQVERERSVGASDKDDDDARASTEEPTGLSADKPREERDYKEYFPDLKQDAQLDLLWTPPLTEDEMRRSANEAKYAVDGASSSSSTSEHVANDLKRDPASLLSSLSNIVNGVVDRIHASIHGSSSCSSLHVVENAQAEHAVVEGQSMFNEKKVGWRPAPGPVLFLKNSLEAVPQTKFDMIDANPDFSRLFKPQTEYHRPDVAYIRLTEPTEDELKERVEYDMDEQDWCWLKVYNAQRAEEDLPPIDSNTFELVIDQLEKHWFNLTKDLQNKDKEPMTLEESLCNICHSGECENSNAIVFCDGCNLAVHQECYGVPYIPEGQWMCRKCMLQPESPVSCLFCPNEGGAFKQTTSNKWVHLLCASWIPEVHVANPVYMEPIEGVERVPKSRWKLLCSICKERKGACIQCSKQSCFCAFHVTCARKAGLYMKVKHHLGDGGDGHASYRVFCDKHPPANWVKGGRDSEMNVRVDVDGDSEEEWISSTDVDNDVAEYGPIVPQLPPSNSQSNLTKSARAHQHGFSQTLPIAPDIVVRLIYDYFDDKKITLRRKQKFILSTCKYWSQKRASRRGAPLLKRLHLEPWTAYSTTVKQDEAQQLQRFQILTHLRTDLEKVRMLIELVRKREKDKLKRMHIQLESLYLKLAPLSCILKRTAEEIKKLDKHNLFSAPVSAAVVPDYHLIVKEPMDFATVTEKINQFKYDTFEQFEEDIALISYNACIYNKTETVYAKVANRLRASAQPLLANAKESLLKLKLDPRTGALDIAGDDLVAPNIRISLPPVQLSSAPPPRISNFVVTNSERENSNHKNASSAVVASAEPSSSKTASLKLTNAKTRNNPGQIVSDEVLKKSPDAVTPSYVYESISEEEMAPNDINAPPTSLRRRGSSKSIVDTAKTPAAVSRKRILLGEPVVSVQKKAKLGASSDANNASKIKKKIVKHVRTVRYTEDKAAIEHLARRHLERAKYLTASERAASGNENLVWGKIPGFPWFPAEVTSRKYREDKAPPEVMALKVPGDKYLGRFLDRDLGEKRTWAWLSENNMERFDYGDRDLDKLSNIAKKHVYSRPQLIRAYYAGCKSRNADYSIVLLHRGLSVDDGEIENIDTVEHVPATTEEAPASSSTRKLPPPEVTGSDIEKDISLEELEKFF